VTIQFLGPLSLSAALSRRMRDLGWVLLAMTGVAILGLAESHRTTADRSLSLAGVAFALVAAVFWAMYILTGSRASATVPGRGGLAVAMTAGALILVPFGARGAWHITGHPHLILLASGMAMMASVVPYSLELAAMRRASKHVFGILLSLEPAIATTAGWLLLGEHAAPTALVAIIIVIAASTGSTLGTRGPSEHATKTGRPRGPSAPAAVQRSRRQPETGGPVSAAGAASQNTASSVIATRMPSAWCAGWSELRGGAAVVDRYLVEPAASRFAWWPVKACDIWLDVDDRCPVDEIDAGEMYDRPCYVQNLDHAEPDGVDPPRTPGGEHALRALLASQQERNLSQRGFATGP
jgi:hypothetical protein